MKSTSGKPSVTLGFPVRKSIWSPNLSRYLLTTCTRTCFCSYLHRLNSSEIYHGAVQEGFDLSLKQLGVDYIDLYLMHWPQAADRKTGMCRRSVL